jgi:hypothetical protein
MYDVLYVCNLLCYFIGIGVPAAASSGAITANSIMTVFEQMKLLDKMKLPDKF